MRCTGCCTQRHGGLNSFFLFLYFSFSIFLLPLSPLSLPSPPPLPLHAAHQRTVAHLGGGVGAGGALVLLDVERVLATAHAQRVRLVVALSETLRTLGLHVAQCRGSEEGGVSAVRVLQRSREGRERREKEREEKRKPQPPCDCFGGRCSFGRCLSFRGGARCVRVRYAPWRRSAAVLAAGRARGRRGGRGGGGEGKG